MIKKVKELSEYADKTVNTLEIEIDEDENVLERLRNLFPRCLITSIKDSYFVMWRGRKITGYLIVC